MAFPTLLDLLTYAPSLVVGVPIAYPIVRALKLRPRPIIIPDPKRETSLALWIIVAGAIVPAVWRAFVYTVYVPAFQLGNHYLSSGQSGQTIDLYDLFAYLLAYSAMILLVVIAMRRTRQKSGSIGIRRNDLGRCSVLGFSLGAILVVGFSLVVPYFGAGFVGFSPTLLYGIVLFTMAGFAEEAIWRGYIQTRVIARLGTFRGLVITSLLFAMLWHFPVSYYQSSGVILDALVSASLRLFPALGFGYVMVKSQNMFASSIFHVFVDWNGILWH